MKTWLRWLWRIPLYLFAGLILGLLLFRWVPVPTSAFMLKQNIASLFDKDVPPVRHHWVGLDKIPRNMQLAVIASEDQRFAEHLGIDVEATRRAIQAELKGKTRGGGSTITQQVAKNLFLWSGRSYVRKGLEWMLAGLLELLWPKERILEVYLNIAQFGKAAYGVGAASEELLHKSVSKLSGSDAALLAAVLPAPDHFNAARPSRYVLTRQRFILRQMRQLGGTALLKKLE